MSDDHCSKSGASSSSNDYHFDCGLHLTTTSSHWSCSGTVLLIFQRWKFQLMMPHTPWRQFIIILALLVLETGQKMIEAEHKPSKGLGSDVSLCCIKKKKKRGNSAIAVPR